MRSFKRRGFTLVELLVVIAITGMLVALLLPAIQAAREAARRAQCNSNLHQLSLGAQNYLSTRKVFPPSMDLAWPALGAGFAVKTNPAQEASLTNDSLPAHGRSWLFMILPYVEQQALYDAWDKEKSLLHVNNIRDGTPLGETDIEVFYCPSRRSSVRDEEAPMMFPFSGNSGENWSNGGTDYGACVGSYNAFHDAGFNSHPPFPHPLFDVSPVPIPDDPDDPDLASSTTIGIFQGLDGVAPAQIEDGLSNTIMLGEMQRVWYSDNTVVHTGTITAGAGSSHDGWACAGVSNLFDTAPRSLGVINNGHYEFPGSEHPGGAFFALADSSVKFFSENVDIDLFSNMGSRADSRVSSEERPR
jgi:prepilin-type N-terminal cleavage/methylation domain-containing protein